MRLLGMDTSPKTLAQAIQYFTDAENCLNYLKARRWPNGVICPTCGRTDASFVPSRRLWQCKTRHPKAQFSIKTGTILEDSPLGLDKWLPVIWMCANMKNGVSSWEIHRSLGVTQKTAWFMLHRIRLGAKNAAHGSTKMGGTAPKSKWMRLSSAAKRRTCTRTSKPGPIMLGTRRHIGKAVVMAFLTAMPVRFVHRLYRT